MASLRAYRRRSCESKVRHASKGAAFAGARGLKGVQVYKCRFCAGWHVGHPTRRARQAMQARRGR